MSRSVTQYERRQRLQELTGYITLLEQQFQGEFPFAPVELLRPILRLCELLVPHCGQDGGELAVLQRRMGALRLRLDHSFATEDTGEHEVTT